MNAIVEGKIGSVECRLELTGSKECVEDTLARFHEWRREFEAKIAEANPKAGKKPCGGCGGQPVSGQE